MVAPIPTYLKGKKDMSEPLLSKPKLPSNFIDAGPGEAHVVRDILLKHFPLDNYVLPQPQHLWEYPDPAGFQPLTQLLEAQYGHPVVITHGAKQGIGACLYALKTLGKQTVGMISPPWCLIPPLVEMHGLTSVPGAHPYHVDSFLALAPNNPDGQFPSMECLQDTCRSKGIPLIHDAVYHNHVYLPPDTPLPVFGDAQIYSASKLYGLSGIRIGWMVCPNPRFYQLVKEYMEAMTVGVSITSQILMHNLLVRMKQHPELVKQFEQECREALRVNKHMLLNVDRQVLEVPDDIADTNGMFGWLKTGPKADFQRAKVNVIDGALFGGPGYVRINLAQPVEVMREIVRRLNDVE